MNELSKWIKNIQCQEHFIEKRDIWTKPWEKQELYGNAEGGEGPKKRWNQV